MRHVLLIGGSDPSGGAGIQADLEVLRDLGQPALSCITALTAQNERRVLQIHPTPTDLLTQQLAAACEGKEIAAVKIGMVAERTNVRAIAWFLRGRGYPNIVIDPVLESSSGTPLLEKEAMTVFRKELLPLAHVLTPNIPEAMQLVGSRIFDTATQEKAARQIYEEIHSLRREKDLSKPFAVVVKGGHRADEAVDVLYDGNSLVSFVAPRVVGVNKRGTGCRFASAIACGLASGHDLPTSIREAKAFLGKYISS